MRTRLLPLLLIGSLAAGACAPAPSGAPSLAPPETTTRAEGQAPLTLAPTTTATPQPALDPSRLYLVMVFDRTEPWTPDDDQGRAVRPWARANTAARYAETTALLEAHPAVMATIGTSASLWDQLDDEDLYGDLSRKPVEQLTEEEVAFIVDRFFDAPAEAIEAAPRYAELRTRRDAGTAFSDQDLQDLRMWWNLTWTAPSVLARRGLTPLLDKGRGFTRDELDAVLDARDATVAELPASVRSLAERGQIEAAGSVDAVLPLLADLELATAGDAAARLPLNRLAAPDDVDAQVERSLAASERTLGTRPRGVVPAGGAVAEQIMAAFPAAGVDWIVAGSHVLARTLDVDVEPGLPVAAAYRPWVAQTSEGPAAVLFSDDTLAGAVTGRYGVVDPGTAVEEFVAGLETIRKAVIADGTGLPPVVTLVIDEKDLWGNGAEFLDRLFSRLESSALVSTITPTELLAGWPEPLETLPDVFPASRTGPHLATWVGEAEEAQAWQLLAEAREAVLAAAHGTSGDAALGAAWDALLLAQSGDWFEWFGDDADSGDDRYVDEAFRELLGRVYDAIEIPRPEALEVPIAEPETIGPDVALAGPITLNVDNVIDEREWTGAARYDLAGEILAGVSFGYDDASVLVRVDFTTELLGAEDEGFDLYLGPGGPRGTTAGGRPLGFGATHRLSWRSVDPLVVEVEAAEDEGAISELIAGFDGDQIEFAVPRDLLGERGGPRFFRIVNVESGPEHTLLPPAPGVIDVPPASTDPVVLVADPVGDDNGWGGVEYPADPVHVAGAYDIEGVAVERSGEGIIIDVDLVGTVTNPLQAPYGLSLQAIDVYIDSDPGAGTGERMLAPGRNAALEDENGWELAVLVDGWEPRAVVSRPGRAPLEVTRSLEIDVAPATGRIRIVVPEEIVPEEVLPGGDPATWGYLVAVAGYDRFAPPGAGRIREIDAGPTDGFVAGNRLRNAPRIIDLLHPDPAIQPLSLGSVPVLDRATKQFDVEDVARVPLVEATGQPSP